MTTATIDTDLVGRGARDGGRLFRQWFDRLTSVAERGDRAAYVFATDLARGARVLDLGCGSGYGAAQLSEHAGFLLGVDRVRPDVASRRSSAHFLRADIAGLPIAPACFDLVVSFQVVEHLENPAPYVDAMAQLVRPEGAVLVTTPNILTSDRVNPFHVHEYEAEELSECLRLHFAEVEMRGVGMSPAVAAWMEARLARIRGIMRWDVLNLRERLPRPLIEWAFGTLAKVVRRGIQTEDSTADVSWCDFPIGSADPGCIDLLAICRRPRAR